MKDDIQIVELKVSEVTPFAGYPFRITDDDKMHELVENIFSRGIQTPLVVHQVEKNHYEIIDGHRRFFAVKEIGFDYIPAIVQNLYDDEATIAMHIQVKRTGKRPMKKGKKQALDYALADIVGKSRGDLHRYFRMKHVIPEIMELVDSKAVAIATAVEISFLNVEYQKWLLEYMKENGACLTYQIFAIRSYLELNETITKIEMIRILNENAPRDLSNRFQRIELTKPTLRKYFPPFFTKTQMENVIFKLLEEWHERNEEDN